MSVAIILTVGFVVLLVVGDEVIQIEAVMGGNEVDGCPGLSPPLVKEVTGSCDALRHLRYESGVTLPEPPHRVAKFVVPFRPSRGKLSDLISAGSYVPGLRNELDAR